MNGFKAFRVDYKLLFLQKNFDRLILVLLKSDMLALLTAKICWFYWLKMILFIYFSLIYVYLLTNEVEHFIGFGSHFNTYKWEIKKKTRILHIWYLSSLACYMLLAKQDIWRDCSIFFLKGRWEAGAKWCNCEAGM